jgi:hypothetical protein
VRCHYKALVIVDVIEVTLLFKGEKCVLKEEKHVFRYNSLKEEMETSTNSAITIVCSQCVLRGYFIKASTVEPREYITISKCKSS